MPCMGPTLPNDEQVNKVADELLIYLKEKKHIYGFSNDQVFRESRQKAIELFRLGVKEILVQDACENW